MLGMPLAIFHPTVSWCHWIPSISNQSSAFKKLKHAWTGQHGAAEEVARPAEPLHAAISQLHSWHTASEQETPGIQNISPLCLCNHQVCINQRGQSTSSLMSFCSFSPKLQVKTQPALQLPSEQLVTPDNTSEHLRYFQTRRGDVFVKSALSCWHVGGLEQKAERTWGEHPAGERSEESHHVLQFTTRDTRSCQVWVWLAGNDTPPPH